jgi:hypothetical protein
MEKTSKYNFYKSIILTATLAATTGAIDFVLGSSIVFAPLIAVVSLFSYKLNQYVQSKHLWVTDSTNSFNERDVEILLNMINLYYRIFSSPFVNPLFKEHMLRETNLKDFLILEELIEGTREVKDITNANILQIYQSIQKLKRRHKNKMSVWTVHRVMECSYKLSNIMEEIWELNFIKDKVKFYELFNLFMTYFHILEIMIQLHHNKVDNLEWMLKCEEFEKEIEHDKINKINMILDSIERNKDKERFEALVLEETKIYDIKHQAILNESKKVGLDSISPEEALLIIQRTYV